MADVEDESVFDADDALVLSGEDAAAVPLPVLALVDADEFGIWKCVVGNGSGGFNSAEIRGAGDDPWEPCVPFNALLVDTDFDKGSGIGTSVFELDCDESAAPVSVDFIPINPNGDGNDDINGFGSARSRKSQQGARESGGGERQSSGQLREQS